MPRYPIKYYTNVILMTIIHKIHKIFRRAVTARGCEVVHYLVSPGFIEGMLHHGKEFYVCISHFFYILHYLPSEQPVILKSPLIWEIIRMLSFPRAKMNLIYGNR